MGGARALPVRKPFNKRRQPEKYKLKSHKGALKRFYQVGDGTFMHRQAGKKHLQTGTSRSRQSHRKLKHKAVTTKGIIKKLRRLMPYGATMRPPPRHRRTSWVVRETALGAICTPLRRQL